MSEHIGKNIIKHRTASWETMQAISVFFFFISRPDIESVFTLIPLSMILISLGISPFYIKSRPTIVTIACCFIIALGIGIGGLTVATLLERLSTETPVEIKDSWVAGAALVCASLGILAWAFVVLTISPVSRPPIIAVVLFAIAGVHSLTYGILRIEAVLSDLPRIASDWEKGIAYLLNGGAMVGWTLLVTRKAAIARRELLVICLMISGVCFIGVGIIHIFDAI